MSPPPAPPQGQQTGPPDGPPRVLLVGNFLSHRVSTRSVCEELADRLRQAGWKVLRTSDRQARLLRLAGMQRSIWRFRRHFDVAQVDVFSGLAFFWAEAAAWSLGRLGKPFVLTLHGGLLPEMAQRWPGRVTRLLSRARAVTTPSAYLQRTLSPYRDDLLLVPNPLDLGRYPYRPRSSFAPRLVWLRAFHETYNPSLAVEVLGRLRERLPEATLLMVGPVKDAASLEKVERRARELGVARRLEIVPGVPKAEVPEQLSRGDVFLNTTNADNTPVSVMEAMACGLAVVSTDVGGLRYLLRDGEDALLVPARDVDSIAAAVERLVHEPELGARLTEAGRRKAEGFDWGVVLPRWQQLLRETAETAP